MDTWQTEMIDAAPPLLSRRQAARIARRTTRTIDRWRETGAIAHRTIPGGGGPGQYAVPKIMIIRDSLREYLMGRE
jgi:hypothetical protein